MLSPAHRANGLPCNAAAGEGKAGYMARVECARAAAVAFLDVATGDVAELTGQAPQSVRSYLPANNPALAG
ncbi:MAG: hypothetical protein ABJX82_00525 [Paracoccaceae bacterium]